MGPQWLFPAVSRSFEGQRWVQIALRCLHLLGIAGAGGAWLHGTDSSTVQPWLILAIVSGLGMAGLHAWSNGVWLLQLRGIATAVKVLLVALAAAIGGATGAWLFAAAVVISGVFAHAPGSWRYYVPGYGVAHALGTHSPGAAE